MQQNLTIIPWFAMLSTNTPINVSRTFPSTFEYHKKNEREYAYNMLQSKQTRKSSFGLENQKCEGLSYHISASSQKVVWRAKCIRISILSILFIKL